MQQMNGPGIQAGGSISNPMMNGMNGSGMKPEGINGFSELNGNGIRPSGLNPGNMRNIRKNK
jgi:hypothetical protein